MVVKHCCYGLCTSDSRYPEKLPEGTKFYFKFYPFTKPGYIKETMTNWEKEKQNQRTEKARRWLNACGRKDFNSIEQITKHTYICSLHFIDPIEENPDPVHATSMTERVGKRKRPKERLPLPSKKTKGENEDLNFVNHGPVISSAQVQEHKATQTPLDTNNFLLTAKIESKSVSSKSNLSTSTESFNNINISYSNESSQKEITHNPMSFDVIFADEKLFHYFIGLDPQQFMILFDFLGPAKESLTYWGTKSRITKFSLKEQLFITLRRGFNVRTLARLYNVDETTIRRIFTTWIIFMFHHFKDHKELIFPNRDVLKTFSPAVFRKFKK